MYLGEIVEIGPVERILNQPLHPYTQGLLNSLPKLETAGATGRQRLEEIPGMVPSLKEEVAGCLFAPRCSYATERCRREYPPLEQKAPGHFAACWESSRVSGGGA